MEGLYVQRTDGPRSWWEGQRMAAALSVCEGKLVFFPQFTSDGQGVPYMN